MTDVFEKCHEINSLLNDDRDSESRDALIKLLDYCKRENVEYTPLINHLIRQTGLYPYMDPSSASWQDRYVYEVFKTDIGTGKDVTLHREQSLLLRKLLLRENIAVSAPTSFGKSFVIDSFIAISKPKNVVIIVPTIALTDETRRRLYKKFSNNYRIITTSDASLSDRNIFIFPQERAISYASKIDVIDLLVIDEFYKASSTFDKVRSPSLLRAILQFGDKAKQRYFLAPNITELKTSVFTSGMEFLCLDFNTVFLEKHELYKDIDKKDEKKKGRELIKILNQTQGKSLIYAGTYSNIKKVSDFLITEYSQSDSPLVIGFQNWLAKNYSSNWYLSSLVGKECGVHNGQLHRSLSQIQIKLFEESNGLKNIVSTSSIIEGVNTSAENVILWSNKNGSPKIDSFTYKNIIGRSGRMFKHFIGKIYILDEPPEDVSTQLELSVPDDLLGDIDNSEVLKELTSEQVAKVQYHNARMSTLLGQEKFESLKVEGRFFSSDTSLLLSIAEKLQKDSQFRKNLGYLAIPESKYWREVLFDVLSLQHRDWGKYGTFVSFVQALPRNWELTIPQQLESLRSLNVKIDDFFALERKVSFQLASLLSDINTIQINLLDGDKSPDISSFIVKSSHAFLPTVVHQLEEYGLPRMISRKLQQSNVIDFMEDNINLHGAVDKLNYLGLEQVCSLTKGLDSFDEYILRFFFDGVSSETFNKR